MRDTSKANAALIIAVLLAAFAVWSLNDGGDRPDPVPPTPPAPVSEVERAASGFITDYRAAMGDVFDSLAADLKAGKFATDADFAAEMESRTRDARHITVEQFRKAWAQGQPEQWDAAGDAKRCEDAARGFRK